MKTIALLLHGVIIMIKLDKEKEFTIINMARQDSIEN